MPLSNCGPLPPPPCDIATATHEGSNVSALAASGARLWSRDLGSPVSRLEVADLDADGGHEVVIGLKTSIKIFDRAGTNIWSAGENTKLRTFIIGHLLRHDPALQITALWNDESRSDLSTYDAVGHGLSTYRHVGRLQYIAIDRPTSHHDFMIIAVGTDNEAGASLGIDQPLGSVLVLDKHSKLRWKGVLLPKTERVTKLAVVRHDKYSRDITLSTTGGEIHLDFDGNVLANSSHRVTFKVLPHKKRRARTSHVKR